MCAIAARDERRASRAGAHFGKYSGIVKDNRDDQKLGQLQLSVPSLFPPDELVTARAALPYGFFFVPENEAKVWVEFEGGDPGLPIWTGIQYVAGEWASAAEANPPQRRVIKTASGHLVQFYDKSGEEKIEIKDGVNGHVITLDSTGIQIKDGKNQHELVLDGQGIQIKDGKNQHQLTLDGQGVQIKDGKNMNTVTLSSSGIKAENAMGAKVSLSGPSVEVNGPMVKLGPSAAMPVLRIGDSGVGNLGAPVPLIGPGAVMVLA
jgi:hypothetical protein